MVPLAFLMITAAYQTTFSVTAGTAATLAGLLFVAISLAPEQDPKTDRAVIQRVRAAAAFLAFINPLAVAIYALIPGNNAGAPAVTFGIIGLFFTAAGARSIFASRVVGNLWKAQLGMLILHFAIFGFQLEAGSSLLLAPHDTAALNHLSDLLFASLLSGMARSWELVGHRQTNVVTSLQVLTGHEKTEAEKP